MSFEQRIVGAGAGRGRLVTHVAFLFALILAGFHFGRFLGDGIDAVRFAWELDYGEGIVWEQMRLMVAGRGYGAIDGMPAIVFHYPPIYHLATAALSALTGADALATGRSVSLGSTLAMGLLAGAIAAKAVRPDVSRRIALICGLVAGLTMFCFAPIVFWAPLMRVDMLSVALSLGGILTAMHAVKRPGFVIASAALFVAAVYTKQVSIVAPAAVFLTFLIVRPRLAWGLAASCVVLGLAALGALQWATDGGFARHIFLYNVNRVDWSRLSMLPLALLTHSLLVVALVVGVGGRLKAFLPRYRGASLAVLRERLLAAPGDLFFLLILVYALLGGLMSLTIVKSGSNVNYFIEAMTAMAILLGIGTRDAAEGAFGVPRAGGTRLWWRPGFIPLMIGLHVAIVTSSVNYTDLSPRRLVELEQLKTMIAQAPGPVISDDMILLRRAGKPVQWEPAIFAELAKTGAWDETAFVDRVRRRQFAFFVTAGTRGNERFDSRYNEAVGDAIDEHYPVKRRLALYTLHLPAEGPR